MTTILFVLVNLAAIWVLPAPKENQLPTADSILNHAINPSSPQGQQILTQYFGKESAKAVDAALGGEYSPVFAAHPELHYIVGAIDNRFYHVGAEGVRYDVGATDAQVLDALSHAKHKVFLFGGSTMFGYGVASDQTIGHYLQQKYAGTDTVVFNFGTNAYDQQREMDKLVYLLERGYVPDEVIFFDGVNDITHMAASNYRVGDKIIYHGFVSGRSRSENPDDHFALPSPSAKKMTLKDYVILQTRAIPLIRTFVQEEIQARSTFEEKTIPQQLDPFQAKLDIKMAEYVFFHWAQLGDQHVDMKKQEILEYYQRNQRFLAHLADAYGFKLHLFFQPMGALDAGNPLVPAMDVSVPGYRYYHEMVPFVRQHIALGELHMMDLSDSLLDISKEHRAYIDMMHYSPEANRRLADIFYAALTKPTKE